MEADCVVIGAGVTGLACARELALAGREVLILEAAGRFGSGISSRSSEVVHAGLYYPPGSLKARLCVAGRGLLDAYCAGHGIAHRRCGKLVVAATSARLPALAALAAQARASGVHDLISLDTTAARALEPALACAGALLSPSTGIVDSHALMLTLLGDAENAGATLVCRAPVTGGAVLQREKRIALDLGGPAPQRLVARAVINAAGLGAAAIAARITGLPASAVPRMHYAKGSYVRLAARAPFSRLVYPLPEDGGLGVHLTLDLAGQARFGPDVEWLEEKPAEESGTNPRGAPDFVGFTDFADFDYRVDPARGACFYAAIRQYWPALADGALQPDYAGIRPKLHGPGAAPADFRIDGPAQHGVPGLVNLSGIESPGLTASLAIAALVAERLRAG